MWRFSHGLVLGLGLGALLYPIYDVAARLLAGRGVLYPHQP